MIDQWKKGAKYWDKAWNPVIGCEKVSEGCANCYAEAMCKRFPTLNGYEFRPKVKFGSKPPKTGVVFCGNMTDLFGEWNSEKEIDHWIAQMSHAGNAEYLILTKRTKQMIQVLTCCPHPFVHIGMTAENQTRYNERIVYYRMVSPQWYRGYHWLSAEPLLGRIDLYLRYIAPEDMPFNWVVVGAESGANRRPCKIEWVEDIVDTCESWNVPVFVKQLDIDGKLVTDINKFPEHLQIRQVPWMERTKQ